MTTAAMPIIERGFCRIAVKAPSNMSPSRRGRRETRRGLCNALPRGALRGEAVGAMKPAQRAERHGMVPAQDDRQRSRPCRLGDKLGDMPAGLLDLGQEAGVLVPGVDRLGHSRADVAAVVQVVAQLADPSVEARVADGGRPHIDAAAAGSQVERRADDRDLALRWLHRHRKQG